MLAGPGAISTAIVLEHQADNLAKQVALAGAIIVVSLGSYLTLRFAAQGARWLNPIAMRIVTRVMGLLLAAVAIQFLINGVRSLKGDLF
jgi:multiple antibiotic resistance protein